MYDIPAHKLESNTDYIFDRRTIYIACHAGLQGVATPPAVTLEAAPVQPEKKEIVRVPVTREALERAGQ